MATTMMQAAPLPPAANARKAASEATRNSFKVVLDLRAGTLTKQEVEFLNGLLHGGSEEEISLASKRLNDTTLFATKSESQDEEDAEDEKSAKVSPGIDLTASFGSSSKQSGSARRRQSLHLRKQSAVHGQIWKAHQNGLAVSVQASRRSIFQKEGSIRHLALANSMKAARQAPSAQSSVSTLDFTSDCDLDDSDSDDEEKTDAPKPKQRPSIGVGTLSMAKLRDLRGMAYRNTRRGSVHSMRSSLTSLRSSVSSTRRGSILSIGTTSTTTSSTPMRSNVASLRRSSVERRRSSLQKKGSQRCVPMAIPEGNEQNSPKSDRRLCRDFPTNQEDKEEKKMNDEEMAQQQEDAWQTLQVRRTSATFGGEGMEVDFFHVNSVEPSETCEDDDDEEDGNDEIKPMSSTGQKKAMDFHAINMRRASVNIYKGEGMEIADWDLQEDLEEQRRESLDNFRHSTHHTSISEDRVLEDEPVKEIVKSASFDELQSMDRLEKFPALKQSRAVLQRSYSEDELSSVLTVHMHNRAKRRSDATAATEESDEESYGEFEYDAWDEEINKEMGNAPFRILGTSADDVDSHPHVLSPPLMESLQQFFPFSKTSDNFWMKYSMVRDGASMHTLLQHARGAKYSILAIETVDGEVMGSFTNEPWRKTWSYFGGGESFLWRMRHSRKAKCHSIIDMAYHESEIDVYPYTGENHCVQFCTSRKIAVGGGSPDKNKASMESLPEEGKDGKEEPQEHDWGYGIALRDDLLHGSTSPCVTFGSPSLSKLHSDGSLFEIINVELWTLTPCWSEAEAEKLELGKLFLEQQSFNSANQSNEDLNAVFG